MKKYLLVLSSMELGGAERQAINFAKYLKRTGHEVTILGLNGSGMVCGICERENITCVPTLNANKLIFRALQFINIFAKVCKQDLWPRGRSLMYELAKYIKNNKFDVCISYCTYANTVLGCTKKYYNKSTYVWFQRDAGIFDSIDGYQKKSIHQMDFVLANGKSGQDWIEKAYGVNAKLIYNGVSLAAPQKSNDEWRNILTVNLSDIICTMIANLSSAKDHMILLKAWKKIYEQEKIKNLVLLFAGRFDDEYESLVEYATENQLLDHIRFLGQIEDITGLLQVTDICVFGAKSEGSPNGIIEAALMGLPVVATDLPEIREIVAEENYEYLFSKSDVASIVQNILTMSDNVELRKNLGQANKEKSQKMFSTDNNFAQIVSIVE